jgi:hypothetical protein
MYPRPRPNTAITASATPNLPAPIAVAPLELLAAAEFVEDEDETGADEAEVFVAGVVATVPAGPVTAPPPRPPLTTGADGTVDVEAVLEPELALLDTVDPAEAAVEALEAVELEADDESLPELLPLIWMLCQEPLMSVKMYSEPPVE